MKGAVWSSIEAKMRDEVRIRMDEGIKKGRRMYWQNIGGRVDKSVERVDCWRQVVRKKKIKRQ